MREEQVTKSILNWLITNSWKVIAFDFPHSGTGIMLQPNNRAGDSKNKGSVIPDIIAFRTDSVIFFENKDRFVLSDINKINDIKLTDKYSDAIDKILKGYPYRHMYFGIGLPYSKVNVDKVNANISVIDFAVLVEQDSSIVTIDPISIFI